MVIHTVSRDAACSASAVDPSGSSVTADDKWAMSSAPSAMPGDLFYGDNLEVMRRHVANESIDLVYLDPPFNSDRNYNLIHKGSQAQERAFADTWTWDDKADRAFRELTDRVPSGVWVPPELTALMLAMKEFLYRDHRDTLAYVSMMAIRIVELHRALRTTGSLYLHCDPTASHYLKMILDAVFGPQNFRNEIVWKRKAGRGETNHAPIRFGVSTDSILFYARSADAPFNRQIRPSNPKYIASKFTHTDEQGRRYRLDNITSPSYRPNLVYEYKGYKPPRNGWAVSPERMAEMDREDRLYLPADKSRRIQRKRYLDELEGETVDSLWDDIAPVNSQAKERLGYPTQKPLSLLDRIIQASSRPGDLVLDPFCGCGTTVEAAETLKRKWIGIDIAIRAIDVIKDRLDEKFQPRVWTEHYFDKVQDRGDE